MTFLERQNYNDGEQINWLKGMDWGGRLTTVTEHEGVLRVTELFCGLIVLVPTQIYTCIKVHRIVQQKNTILLPKLENETKITFNSNTPKTLLQSTVIRKYESQGGGSLPKYLTGTLQGSRSKRTGTITDSKGCHDNSSTRVSSVDLRTEKRTLAEKLPKSYRGLHLINGTVPMLIFKF